MYVHVHVCMYICTYVCMYVCMYIYICTVYVNKKSPYSTVIT